MKLVFRNARRHDDGTHPTADTTALMFQQSRGAAGDAGR